MRVEKRQLYASIILLVGLTCLAVSLHLDQAKDVIAFLKMVFEPTVAGLP